MALREHRLATSPAQATGAEEFAAACSLGRLGSHLTARNRWPVTMSASLEHSHKVGGTIASGWISWARSKPASRGTAAVFAGPPGTRTLAVTPVPDKHGRASWRERVCQAVEVPGVAGPLK